MENKFYNDNGQWPKTIGELEKVERLVSVWLIMKDGIIKGRITARWTKTRTYPAVHLAFIMYVTEDYVSPIFDCEKVRGWGFDMAGFGIANILNECRETLKENYNIELSAVGENVANTWKRDFENAGFTILQAI